MTTAIGVLAGVGLINTNVLTAPTFAQLNQAVNTNVTGTPLALTSDLGVCFWNSGVSSWSPIHPFIVYQSGTPFIYSSNGTMSANGAFTLSTALPRAYEAGYMYLPNGAIQTGSEKGWWYVQMSSTTAGIVYPYKYMFGQPNVPSSPTPFVSTGPGAWTMPGTSVLAQTANLPPLNVLGLNTRVEYEITFACTSSVNTKGTGLSFAGTNVFSSDNVSTAGVVARSTRKFMTGRGVAGLQVAAQNTNGDIGTVTAVNYNAVDSGHAAPLGTFINVANTGEACVIEQLAITCYPSALRDLPPPLVQIPAGSAIVPPGAAANGYTVNKWFVNPTGSDVSFALNDTTHNLYAGLWYQAKPPYNTNKISTVNGMLNIQFGVGDTVVPNVATVNQSSGTPAGSYGALPLLTAANGIYVEAAITLSSNDQDHFFGWYMIPVEHNQGNNTYVEDDFDESGNDKDTNDPFFGSTNTTINWVAGTPNTINNDTGGIAGALYGPNIDRTVEHIFGSCYNPTTKTITYWLDGVQQPLVVSTAAFDTHIQPFHFYAIFDLDSKGQNLPYNATVRYFSAWSSV